MAKARRFKKGRPVDKDYWRRAFEARELDRARKWGGALLDRGLCGPGKIVLDTRAGKG